MELVVCRVAAVKSKETHRTCSVLTKVYFVSLPLIRAMNYSSKRERERERKYKM